jgi:hypothetical protein
MVMVPANLGYEKSVWVPLRSQVRPVLPYDSRGQPHAFIVCEPASTQHRAMTRPEWMLARVGGVEPSGGGGERLTDGLTCPSSHA